MSSLLMFSRINLASNAVSILAGILIYLNLTGKNLPLIANDKVGFYILWFLGLLMSALAGMRDAPDGNFNIPQLLLYLLMILGFLAFVLLFYMFIDFKIPLIISFHEAFNILAFIIVFKWVAVHLYRIYQIFV